MKTVYEILRRGTFTHLQDFGISRRRGSWQRGVEKKIQAEEKVFVLSSGESRDEVKIAALFSFVFLKAIGEDWKMRQRNYRVRFYRSLL